MPNAYMTMNTMPPKDPRANPYDPSHQLVPPGQMNGRNIPWQQQLQQFQQQYPQYGQQQGQNEGQWPPPQLPPVPMSAGPMPPRPLPNLGQPPQQPIPRLNAYGRFGENVGPIMNQVPPLNVYAMQAYR